MNNDINKYYLSLIQEISTRQLSNEDGDNQEQTFTRYVFDVLSEAGETENATVAFDEKDLGTKKQHKINGYAIADNYETVDLFISIYGCEESIYSTPKTEIDRASTRIYNPQIQISAESETKRSIFREKDKTKRSKKESAQHSKSRNKSFVMTSVSAL